jgi:hypothetical protein
MGITLLALVLPLALTAGGEAVHQTPIDAEIHSIVLPQQTGTDSNIQFTVETKLSPSCFSLKPAAVRINYERNVILFHIEAIRTADNCTAGDSNLSEILTIGSLAKGTYEIRSLKDVKVWGHLRVQDQLSYAQNP